MVYSVFTSFGLKDYALDYGVLDSKYPLALSLWLWTGHLNPGKLVTLIISSDCLFDQPSPEQLFIFVLSSTLCPWSLCAGQLCSEQLLYWLCHLDLWPWLSLFYLHISRYLGLSWSGPWWLCLDQTCLDKLSIPVRAKCVHSCLLNLIISDYSSILVRVLPEKWNQ